MWQYVQLHYHIREHIPQFILFYKHTYETHFIYLSFSVGVLRRLWPNTINRGVKGGKFNFTSLIPIHLQWNEDTHTKKRKKITLLFITFPFGLACACVDSYACRDMVIQAHTHTQTLSKEVRFLVWELRIWWPMLALGMQHINNFQKW